MPGATPLGPSCGRGAIPNCERNANEIVTESAKCDRNKEAFSITPLGLFTAGYSQTIYKEQMAQIMGYERTRTGLVAA